MFSKLFILFLSYFFLSLTIINGHRILVTSVGLAASQNLIMGRVADVLGTAGNDVTLFRWILVPETKAVKLQHSKEIAYKMFEKKETIDFFRTTTQSLPWEKHLTFNMPPFRVMKHWFDEITNGCDRLLQDKEMIERLKAEKYDVIVIHTMDFCTFGLTEILGVKAYTWFSTAFMMDFMATFTGTSAPPSFVPSVSHVVTDQMNFPERVKNLFMTLFINGMFTLLLPQYTNLFREHYGPKFPSMDHLVRESQLIFINSDPFFEYSRPTQHNVIYVGGLTMKKPEPLNEEWQKIVKNARPGGLVLFSLGTVANTTRMPLEYKQRFLNVFKRFPDYTFIYRLEGQLPDAIDVPNVVFPKWIPQKDLLADPRVKCFITHGGYNSLTEATFLGVPMVVLPLFGDQQPNAKRVVRKNVGRVIDKDDLTEESINQALDEVLSSKEIQSNADRLAEMMHKKPVASVDLMIGWINFLAEFKNLDSLKPVSRNMGLIKYYMIDVLAFLLACLIIFVWIVPKLFSLCSRKVVGVFGKKSKKD